MLADEFMRKTAEARIKKTLKHPFKCLVHKRSEQEWIGYSDTEKIDLYDICIMTEINGDTFYAEGNSSYTLENACDWVIEVLERTINKFTSLSTGEYLGDEYAWLTDQLNARYKDWHCHEHGLKFRTFEPLKDAYAELDKILESNAELKEKLQNTHRIELPFK